MTKRAIRARPLDARPSPLSTNGPERAITCYLDGGVARDERAGVGRLAARRPLLDDAVVDALVGARPARPPVQHLARRDGINDTERLASNG